MYTEAYRGFMSARIRNLVFLSVALTPAVARAQAPVGELFSTTAQVRGSVTLAGSGMTVMSGSSITSGEQTARLQLTRGGELNVCAGTSIAVSASANGRDLMFSFGSGSIESRYAMQASSDVIVTPDLRLVITGPGEFDLDIAITPAGDTCVRSHRDSTGGVIVNEQFGDGIYQVKPSDSVLFRKGKVADASVNPQGVNCGCPSPKSPLREIEVASAPVAPTLPLTPPPAAPPPPKEETTQPAADTQHLVADAPFVFNADTPPAPVMTKRVMRLHVEAGNSFADFHPAVQPPPVATKPPHKNFWRRLGKALFG
jgi:hypothetical protein